MNALATVFVLGLALGGIIDLWFEGSIFQGLRARNESYADAFRAGHRRYFWAGALECPFCLSYSAVVLTLVLLYFLPVAVSGFAAVKALWLVNDLVGKRKQAG